VRHTVSPERVADLQNSESGLNTAQVEERRKHFGTNTIMESTTANWLDVLRDSARDPMIWFLVGISALFSILGDIPSFPVKRTVHEWSFRRIVFLLPAASDRPGRHVASPRCT
jgi:Ca2+-transporting ATPase